MAGDLIKAAKELGADHGRIAAQDDPEMAELQERYCARYRELYDLREAEKQRRSESRKQAAEAKRRERVAAAREVWENVKATGSENEERPLGSDS